MFIVPLGIIGNTVATVTMKAVNYNADARWTKQAKPQNSLKNIRSNLNFIIM
jgi:hypothetical protein